MNKKDKKKKREKPCLDNGKILSFGREHFRQNRERGLMKVVHCTKLTGTLSIHRRDLLISYHRLGLMSHASTVNEICASMMTTL